MSPNKQTTATSDLYTAILAISAVSVLATAVFVAMKCMSYYETLFRIVSAR